MRARQNIVEMSSKDLERYRKAVSQLQSLPDSDPDSYAALAALHMRFCQHGNALFLPWHRAYLLRFEAALRRVDAAIAIPYWNWLEFDAVGPAPAVFYEQEVTIDGKEAQNPLWLKRCGFPHSADDVPTPNEWADLLKACPSWTDFSASFERLHNKIHRWASAEMTDLMAAPKDPIFWSHHAFIDLLWSQQQGRPGREPRGLQLNEVVPGLCLKVGDLLSVTDHGYEYSVRTDILPGSIVRASTCTDPPPPPKRFRSVRIEMRAAAVPLGGNSDSMGSVLADTRREHPVPSHEHPNPHEPPGGTMPHAGHLPDHREYCILPQCASSTNPMVCIREQLLINGSTLPNGQQVDELRIVYLP